MNVGLLDEFVHMKNTSKTGMDELIKNHLQILENGLKYSSV
jgi:hypothetical protein